VSTVKIVRLNPVFIFDSLGLGGADTAQVHSMACKSFCIGISATVCHRRKSNSSTFSTR